MVHGHSFDDAMDTANGWLRSVAEAFDTDDPRFVRRALRAWLHGLRDELSVDVCASLGAQLPMVLRGLYYEGWDPRRVPLDHDLDAFVSRFAREAHVRPSEVRRVASTVTAGVSQHIPALQLAAVFEQLPHDLRELMWAPPDVSHAAASRTPAAADERVDQLASDVEVLKDAVRELVRALEPTPFASVEDRTATDAVHRAHQRLLAASR